MVGIQKNDTFKQIVLVAMHMRLGEKFHVVTNKLDAFAVRAIHKHDIFFDDFVIVVIKATNKITEEMFFPVERFAVKYNVGDFAMTDVKIELFFDGRMNGLDIHKLAMSL